MTIAKPKKRDLEVGRHGLRTFNFTKTELLSVSMRGSNWHNGVCVAKCLAGKKHASPHKGCECGIYATLTMEHLRTQWRTQAEYLVTVIAAEGKTIIGDRGLQTAYARIVAWWAPKEIHQMMIAELLPEVPRFPELADMLAAYHFPAWEPPAPAVPSTDISDLTLNVPVTIADIKAGGGRLSITVPAHSGVYTKVRLADGYEHPFTAPIYVNSWFVDATVNFTWTEP